MLRFAVIGLGKWGKNLIAEFQRLGEVIYCVSRGNKTNIDWLKKNFPNIQYNSSLEFILSQKEIDAVVIATPLRTHFKLAKKSLLAGKHVFIEKPPCTSLKESKELLDLAKDRNLEVFVDNTFFYDNAFRKLRKNVNMKDFTFAEFKWFKWGTFKENIYWNLAYHDIYLSIALFGIPKSIQISPESGSDLVHFQLIFENGKSSVYINRLLKGESSKTILVESSKMNYLWKSGKLYEGKKEVFSSRSLPLENSCREFVKQVQLKKKTYQNFLLSQETIKILEEVDKKIK